MDMEQQYRQVPPMQPESYGKRVWHLWGPILIKWAVGIGVSMIAMGVLSMVYVMADQEAAMIAMQSEEKMMELYDKILNQYLNASTLIEGVAALITIPLMLGFFHSDRESVGDERILSGDDGGFLFVSACCPDCCAGGSGADERGIGIPGTAL